MRYLLAFLTLTACSKPDRTPEFRWVAKTTGTYSLRLQGVGSDGRGDIAVTGRTDDTVGLEARGFKNGTTITVGTETLDVDSPDETILFDPRPHLGTVDVAALGSDAPVELDVPITIRFPGAENTFSTKLQLLSIGDKLLDAFEGVEKGPLAFATDGTTAPGVFVITSRQVRDSIQREHRVVGTPAKVRDLGWVVLVDQPIATTKPCGRYADSTGTQVDVYLTVHSTRVRAFERKTGKAAGEKSFGGKAGCPKTVVQEGFIADPHEYTGGDAANAWIEKFASERVATR